ncbi:MAG: MFS transporter [Phycisphaerales bacterium]|nr:MFS transporter [Phycisphaerales bacterium]
MVSDRRLQRRAIVAGAVGNVLEWYTFAVYGYLAPTIGPLFFPSEDPVTSTLSAYGVFAVGYLMRPLGAIFLGRVGDRIGRRAMMVWSICLMGIASFLMGVLPTHAAIGVASPIALTLLRMIQGFSVGGEFTGSMTYLTEVAPHHRRGVFSSLAVVGGLAGMFLGIFSNWILIESLGTEGVAAWGWRLPFLLGLPIALLGLRLRRSIPETKVPMAEVVAWRDHGGIWVHVRRVLWIIALVTGANVLFYTAFVYAPDAAIAHRAQGAAAVQGITTAAIALQGLAIVLGGWLADTLGRRAIALWGGIACAVWAWPGLSLLLGEGFLWQAMIDAAPFLDSTSARFWIGEIPLTLSVGVIFGVQGVMIAEAVERELRCSLVSIGYSISIAFFAGTAPVLTAWIQDRAHWPDLIGIYCAVWCVLAVWAAAVARETSPSHAQPR